LRLQSPSLIKDICQPRKQSTIIESILRVAGTFAAICANLSHFYNYADDEMRRE
jgi:hypothetical protein